MNEQTNTDMSKHFYRASAADFMKIPGSPIAYWVSEGLVKSFTSTQLSELTDFTGSQNITANNNKYLRRWFEVSLLDFGVNEKWLLYSKGGPYRKYYGNLDWVVDWSDAALQFYKSNSTSNLLDEKYWHRKGISYTDITSSGFSARLLPEGASYDKSGPSFHLEKHFGQENGFLAAINNKFITELVQILNPTIHCQVKDVKNLPFDFYLQYKDEFIASGNQLMAVHKADWNSSETAFEFDRMLLVHANTEEISIFDAYSSLKKRNEETVANVSELEQTNNKLFIEAYGLQDELTPEVPLNEITLTCNPHYRYSGDLTDQEREDRLQSDTIAELVSYAIGCMMGRYSLDKEGLILASQGETIQDYLAQIPNPSFMPDEDAIIPLTDEEWFPDDATNLVRDFIRTVWGEETLQENLDFIAESLCLHAIRARKSETALETIRRYLSTQFYKDHMRTYKKRPIYWLFSSGKQKAFECLVYLHRYNESTLSRMRTEYVTQLMGKYESQINHLEEQVTQASTSEKTKLNRALRDYHAKLNELREFDNKLKHYADMRIALDLDDGVKENYGKFGDLLANVRDITGKKPQ